MSEPDLSTLPSRIRYAVNTVLQEVFDEDRDLYDKYGMPLMCDLLDAASRWDSAERHRDELARDLFAAQKATHAKRDHLEALTTFECASPGLQENCRSLAAILISSGYRKDEW